MNNNTLIWLLEDKNPEVKLRVLKEGLGYKDNDPEVVLTRENLMNSKIYAGVLKKLRSDKKWSNYDALLAFAEWGLTRTDIGKELDEVVFEMIDKYGFQMLCGEPLLLRNLVKLGYGDEKIITNEINSKLKLIQADGGFRCISTNKRINNPNKEHKSCARLTVCYLMLAAELMLCNIEVPCKDKLLYYFTRRNIFYRTDDRKQPMVDIMTETFYPADPIKIGVQYIVYSLKVLGCQPNSEAMKEGYRVLDQYKLPDGRYIISDFKSVPAFKPGTKKEVNKWITLYANMAKGALQCM